MTTKNIFESDLWIITSIQFSGNNVRIDAKKRFFSPGEQNRFSKWVSLKYANKLARANFGKNINDFGFVHY